MSSNYKLKQTTTSENAAKISEYESQEQDLRLTGPGVFFSIDGKEDYKDFPKVLDENLQNLSGAHIPRHLLREWGEKIKSKMDSNQQLLSTTGGMEALYYSNIVDEKLSMIENLPFTDEEEEMIEELKDSRSSVGKDRKTSALSIAFNYCSRIEGKKS